MKCFNCAFFTGNDVLFCAVNPSHCQINAEPCKEFELDQTKSEPLVIVDGNFVFVPSWNGHALLEERDESGETVFAWIPSSYTAALPAMLDETNNTAIRKFLENCPI